MLKIKKKRIILNNDIKSLSKNQFYKFLKRSIFLGHILIFKNNYFILRIINNINQKYNLILDKKHKSKFKEKLVNSQILLKNDMNIVKIFKSFLNSLGFFDHQTFIDKITLRYTPPKETESIGLLKPLASHRDTWGSNILEQINWWFPIEDTSFENSIYIIENKFSSFVKNNSSDWDFMKFKKNSKKFLSSPISENKFEIKTENILKLKKGDLLCFSGHHLHGSFQGSRHRINLETRTVSINDKNKFIIPDKKDNFAKKRKSKWFRNIYNKSLLSTTNY